MIFFQSVFFTEPDTDSLLVETLGYKIQNAVTSLLVSPEGWLLLPIQNMFSLFSYLISDIS